jgi:hypothetical protein
VWFCVRACWDAGGDSASVPLVKARIDALGDGFDARLEALSGETLSPDLDDRLQAIVAEAASIVGAPIALVSLVLRRTQFFRAHHGLPDDLEAVRATDRDVSFCQLVVRDERALVVEEAVSDERVPHDLVNRYGIRAYAGEPVRVGDTVVGSLCAIDVRPRGFSPKERAALANLATRASERLTELAGVPRLRLDLAQKASLPLFAELRNALAAVDPSLALSRVAHTEVASVVRLEAYRTQVDAPPLASGALEQARLAIVDLGASIQDLDHAMSRVADGLFGLEDLLAAGDEGAVTLRDAMSSAQQLALHRTKVIGGLRVELPPGDVRLRASRSVAVSVLAVALARTAELLRTSARGAGIDVVAHQHDGVVQVRMGSPNLRAESAQALVDGLEALGVQGVRFVRVGEATVVLELDAS